MVCINIVLYAMAFSTQQDRAVIFEDSRNGIRHDQYSLHRENTVPFMQLSGAKLMYHRENFLQFCTPTSASLHGSTLSSIAVETGLFQVLNTEKTAQEKMPYYQNCLAQIRGYNGAIKNRRANKIYKISSMGKIGHFCTPDLLLQLTAMHQIKPAGPYSCTKSLSRRGPTTSEITKPLTPVLYDQPLIISTNINVPFWIFPVSYDKHTDYHTSRIAVGIHAAQTVYYTPQETASIQHVPSLTRSRLIPIIDARQLQASYTNRLRLGIRDTKTLHEHVSTLLVRATILPLLTEYITQIVYAALKPYHFSGLIPGWEHVFKKVADHVDVKFILKNYSRQGNMRPDVEHMVQLAYVRDATYFFLKQQPILSVIDSLISIHAPLAKILLGVTASKQSQHLLLESEQETKFISRLTSIAYEQHEGQSEGGKKENIKKRSYARALRDVQPVSHMIPVMPEDNPAQAEGVYLSTYDRISQQLRHLTLGTEYKSFKKQFSERLITEKITKTLNELQLGRHEVLPAGARHQVGSKEEKMLHTGSPGYVKQLSTFVESKLPTVR